MTVDFDSMPPPATAEEDAQRDFVADEHEEALNLGVAGDNPICESCHRVIVRKPGARGRKPKWHPECRPSVKTSGTPRKRTKKTAAPSYEEGINSLFQVGAFGLMMAAGDHNKPVLADSKALAEHGPGIAQALDMLAQEKPEVAAVLDKILAVGPYGLVLSAVAPLAMQIARNHGVALPGVPGPDEYLAVPPQGGPSA